MIETSDQNSPEPHCRCAISASVGSMIVKQVYLIATLVLTLCGCSQKAQPTWKPMLDGGHHVGIDGVSIFAFGYNHDPDRSIVFFFPLDISSSGDHSSNAESRTFDYSGTITSSPSKKTVLSYRISSTDPTKVTCNNADYRLSDGTVFYVAKDGAITQLPFAGLGPTKEYVSDLQAYVDSNRPEPTNPEGNEP
ncbi:hypothetical protein [Thalassoglobus neptunius]|nr:hypothetical protein [Thalassoglobus neptunius]